MNHWNYRFACIVAVLVVLFYVLDNRSSQGRRQNVNWGGGGVYSYIRVLRE